MSHVEPPETDDPVSVCMSVSVYMRTCVSEFTRALSQVILQGREQTDVSHPPPPIRHN